MATAVTMPKLGLTMTRGKVVKWLKQNGEQVEKGQPIVVVMSKKITYEMEAPASGVLRIVAQPKESRPVTKVIGFILKPGEPMPETEKAAPPTPSPWEGEGRGEGAPVPSQGEGRGEGAPVPSQGEGRGEGAPVPSQGEGRGEGAPVPSQGEGRGEGAPVPSQGEGRGEGAPAPSQGEGRGEGAPAPAKEKPRQVRSSPAARRLARELGVDITRVQGTGSSGRIAESDVQRFYDEQSRVQATPLARRMAEEEGLDLAQIQGTGPGGRITEDDVLRVLEGPALSEAEGRGGLATALPRIIPFAGMRQAIAEGMMESLHSMAQLTLTARADVTGMVELRDVLRQRWDARISYTDLIVKAVALALREHPILNSTLVGEEIVLHDEVNIGVAVALPPSFPPIGGDEGGESPIGGDEGGESPIGGDEGGGLIVPVVRQVDQKSVLEIHQAVQNLAKRARKDALSVDEVTGGTFTITNLGMYGVDTFTPIINPPEAAILGVGCITEELALANGQVVARSKMALSLTIDHRIVDGAPGAAFLQTLVQFLEHPALIFAEGPALSKVEGEA